MKKNLILMFFCFLFIFNFKRIDTKFRFPSALSFFIFIVASGNFSKINDEKIKNNLKKSGIYNFLTFLKEEFISNFFLFLSFNKIFQETFFSEVIMEKEIIEYIKINEKLKKEGKI